MTGLELAQRAAELLQTEPTPPLPAAEVGATPATYNGCSDTCAAYEDDDVHYVTPHEKQPNNQRRTS